MLKRGEHARRMVVVTVKGELDPFAAAFNEPGVGDFGYYMLPTGI
jgi:hypothetical protein